MPRVKEAENGGEPCPREALPEKVKGRESFHDFLLSLFSIPPSPETFKQFSDIILSRLCFIFVQEVLKGILPDPSYSRTGHLVKS